MYAAVWEQILGKLGTATNEIVAKTETPFRA